MAQTFTGDAVTRLGGPAWLRERRVAALDALDDLPEPHSGMEEWRYSRIDDLDVDRYDAPGVPDAETGPGDALDRLAELGEVAGAVVTRDGAVVHHALDEALAARGVVLAPASAAPEDRAREAVGAAMSAPADRFAALNDAFTPDPVVLSVPGGVTVDRPVVVVHLVDAGSAGTFVAPRLSVWAGPDSEVAVIEVVTSPEDLDALVLPVTEVAVGRAARVRYGSLQDLGRSTNQIGSFVADVDGEATLSAGVAALGGDYARLRLDCRLTGRGATGRLSSAYFGEGDQMLDLRTFQEHRAPDTTSDLLFKGAVADRSHSVYTGLIRILPEGRGTNAFQTNRNLKLSDDAWAESVPNLEIENNDVHCSHASTVGPVDPEQRFYLESRGVPTEIADRLIVAGFFDEVLDGFPVPALAAPVRRHLAGLLDRLVATGAEVGA